jgi:hypothetical protein
VQHLQNHCCPSQPLVHLEHVASCELGHHPAQRRYVRPDGHCQSRHGQQHSGGGPRTRSGTCHKQVSAGRGASSPHRRPLGGALDFTGGRAMHKPAACGRQPSVQPDSLRL